MNHKENFDYYLDYNSRVLVSLLHPESAFHSDQHIFGNRTTTGSEIVYLVAVTTFVLDYWDYKELNRHRNLFD